MVMKKVFGKTIATPSWQEAEKLANAKQAKQEAKAESKQAKEETKAADETKDIKISGIDVKAYDGTTFSTVFEAHLSNGKSAIFDMAELTKFEKVNPIKMAEFNNSFAAELFAKTATTHKSVSESACDKMLTSHHIDKAEFMEFLVNHITDDHA